MIVNSSLKKALTMHEQAKPSNQILRQICALTLLFGMMQQTCLAQNGNGAKPPMPDDLLIELDESILAQYQTCWNAVSPGPINPDDNPVHYKPKLKVSFAPDGSLQSAPILLNPPKDPNEKKIAETALLVAKAAPCNPLKISDKFTPYYDAWKVSILSFAPDDGSEPAEKSGFFLPAVGDTFKQLFKSIRKAF